MGDTRDESCGHEEWNGFLMRRNGVWGIHDPWDCFGSTLRWKASGRKGTGRGSLWEFSAWGRSRVAAAIAAVAVPSHLLFSLLFLSFFLDKSSSPSSF